MQYILSFSILWKSLCRKSILFFYKFLLGLASESIPAWFTLSEFFFIIAISVLYYVLFYSVSLSSWLRSVFQAFFPFLLSCWNCCHCNFYRICNNVNSLNPGISNLCIFLFYLISLTRNFSIYWSSLWITIWFHYFYLLFVLFVFKWYWLLSLWFPFFLFIFHLICSSFFSFLKRKVRHLLWIPLLFSNAALICSTVISFFLYTAF